VADNPLRGGGWRPADIGDSYSPLRRYSVAAASDRCTDLQRQMLEGPELIHRMPDGGELMRRQVVPNRQRLKLMSFKTQETTVPLSVTKPKISPVFGFMT
jgi:hypothetical protein